MSKLRDKLKKVLDSHIIKEKGLKSENQELKNQVMLLK